MKETDNLIIALASLFLTLPRKTKKWLDERGQTNILKAIIVAGLLIGLAILQSGLMQEPFIGEVEAGSPSTWYNSNWDYCKEIWLQDSAIAGSLSNFPVTIQVDFSGIDASKTQDNGDDILFATDGGTKLNHEIDGTFDESSTNIFHVNITSLTDGQNNSIFMYYGNSGAANQENVIGTWNSNYVAVYHMHDASGNAQITDSTSSGNDASESGDPIYGATGKIGDCIEFDGSGDYFEDTAPSNIPAGGSSEEVTIEYWIDADAVSGGDGVVPWHIREPSGSADGYLNRYEGGTCWFRTHGGNSGGGISLSTNTWTHIGQVWDCGSGTDAIKQYKDGGSTPDYTADETDTSSGDQDFRVGKGIDLPSSNQYDGHIDEFRISNVERGGNWIATSYNFQNSPSGSIEVGSEQTSGWTNTAPTFSGWQPTATSLLQPDANITINDQDGNDTTVDWYWSDDGGSTWTHFDHYDNHPANTSNSTTCTFATSLDTTYYLNVTANDTYDNVSKTWSFNTLASQGSSDGFGGKIVVSSGEANISLSPSSFGFGNVELNGDSNTTGSKFTLYNNGSSAVKVNITVNDTSSWTAVQYSSIGWNKFAMNFTTDDWTSETNIVPADPPETTLTASLAAGNSMTFGLRIIMPTGTSDFSEQSLTVYLTGEVT